MKFKRNRSDTFSDENGKLISFYKVNNFEINENKEWLIESRRKKKKVSGIKSKWKNHDRRENIYV